MSQMFSDPRRIVTGHDAVGKAVVVADGTVPCLPVPVQPRASLCVLYETHEFPVSQDEWSDPIDKRTTDLANSDGLVLRVVDIDAQTDTFFHRTESLDFGILLKGEITCYLDDGARIDMREGDVCIQRGTVHCWTNHSDKPARMYFVLTAAKPVKIKGELLTKTGYSAEEMSSGGRD